MEKVKSIFINALIVFTVVFGIAFAENSMHVNADVSEYLTYTISDGEVTITDFDESFFGDVIIPSVIEGYPVTSIGDEAFAYCQGIDSIEVPDSVTCIGKGAFFECWGLRKMTIPFVGNTLNGTENTYFGYIFGADDCYNQYQYLPSIDKLIILDATNIAEYAFADCYFGEIVLPSGMTTISKNSFAECYINEIVIPDGVITIEECAFYWSGIKSVKIPESVTTIKDKAFCYSELENATIPDSVTYIGNEAFAECRFKSIEIPDSVTYIGEFSFWSSYLESAVISGDNLVIERWAFSGSSNLTDVTISDGVYSIGMGAFSDCYGLERVTFLNSMPSIDSDIFGLSPLCEITMPYMDRYIGHLFGGSEDYGYNDYVPSSLKTVTITGGTDIPDNAFNGCETISNIILPDGLLSIGNSAFEGCISLNDIKIPDSVTIIGDSAFKGCCCLPDINLPDGLYSIGSAAFEGCELFTSVKIPEGVTSLGGGLFFGCTSLEKVELPCIADEYGCPYFYDVFGYPMYGCEDVFLVALKEVVINGGSLLYNFWDCYGITSITIPATVTKIEFYYFANCTSLQEINVSADNAYYSSVDGVLYNKDKTVCIKCPEGKNGEIVIPDSVKTIDWYSFQNCSGVTSVTIPYGVSTIEWFAFENCTGLTEVFIPDSVTTIVGSAFRGCDNVEKITLPFVGSEECTNLGCIFDAHDYFYNSSYVPATLKEVVVTDADNIDEGAFLGCSTLTDITILGEVKSIGKWAFADCFNLTCLTLPNSITDIGESAFGFCDSLTDIYFLGSEAEWNSINISDDDGNACLLDATIHFIDGFSVSDDSSMKVDDEKGFVSSIEIGNTVSDIVSQFDTYGDIAVVDSEGNALADNSVIATGYKVQRLIDGVVVDEIDTVVAGDTDGDGAATIADTQTAYSLLMGGEPVSGVYAEAAKATGGSSLSILDVMAILNKI